MLSIPAALLAVCAVGSGQTVLLDFQAEWCGPCRAMAPIVDSLAAAGMPIRKVDIDREPALAAQHKVEGVPCFVLLVDGREVDRVTGATTRERLIAMCKKAQSAAPTTARAASASSAGVPVHLVSGPARGSGSASSGARPFPLPPMQGGPAVSLAGAVAIDPPGSVVAAAPLEPERRQPSPFEAGQRPQPQAQPQPQPQARAIEPAQPAPRAAEQPPAASEPILPSDPLAQSLAASVRLRIEDTQGHAWGSGTIIDSQDNAALIVTCGHIFRESRSEGRITVDLFGPGAPQGLRGYLIKYDLKRDVGLLRIETTGRVPFVRVAPVNEIRPGDPVASIGCASGGQPEVHPSRINSINKFLGPPNLQVAGQPVQGRSGGGLFNRQGEVIGICNAADPADNEGLFAALGSIHAVLDETKLTHIYRPLPRTEALAAAPQELSAAAVAPPSDFDRRPEEPRAIAPVAAPLTVAAPRALPARAPRPSPADDLPHFARGRGPLSPLGRSGVLPVARIETPATLASLPASHRGFAPAAADSAGGDHAEVICVIRSLSDPQSKSEIVVLDRASPEFVRQLVAEQEVQRGRHMTSLAIPKDLRPARPAAARPR